MKSNVGGWNWKKNQLKKDKKNNQNNKNKIWYKN